MKKSKKIIDIIISDVDYNLILTQFIYYNKDLDKSLILYFDRNSNIFDENYSFMGKVLQYNDKNMPYKIYIKYDNLYIDDFIL